MIAVNGKAMNYRPSIADASIVGDSSLERNQKMFPVSLNQEDEQDRVSDGMIKKKVKHHSRNPISSFRLQRRMWDGCNSNSKNVAFGYSYLFNFSDWANKITLRSVNM